jgi:hypothetical protein
VRKTLARESRHHTHSRPRYSTGDVRSLFMSPFLHRCFPFTQNKALCIHSGLKYPSQTHFPQGTSTEILGRKAGISLLSCLTAHILLHRDKPWTSVPSLCYEVPKPWLHYLSLLACGTERIVWTLKPEEEDGAQHCSEIVIHIMYTPGSQGLQEETTLPFLQDHCKIGVMSPTSRPGKQSEQSG